MMMWVQSLDERVGIFCDTYYRIIFSIEVIIGLELPKHTTILGLITEKIILSYKNKPS